MNKVQQQQHHKRSRLQRNRRKVLSSSSRPRLHVYRSNKHIYCQLIDDTSHKTIVSSSDIVTKATGTKIQKATIVGADLAKKAKQAKITKVKFDRGMNKYHGRIKALAQAARDGGLEF